MHIGDMLINEGLLNEAQLDEALGIQNEEPDRLIGEILIELDYIDIDKFTLVLDRQLKEMGLMQRLID